jgi:nucleotide-binding universal stress UspA family protein
VFSSILVPIDIAHPSSWRCALPQAVELAAASRGALTAMTVVREPKAMFEATYFSFQLEQMLSNARNRVAQIAADYTAADLRIDAVVRFGSIGREVIACAKELAVDLILMASHRPEVRDYFIGPNAAYVAQHATCSVLILRRTEA